MLSTTVAAATALHGAASIVLPCEAAATVRAHRHTSHGNSAFGLNLLAALEPKDTYHTENMLRTPGTKLLHCSSNSRTTGGKRELLTAKDPRARKTENTSARARFYIFVLRYTSGGPRHSRGL